MVEKICGIFCRHPRALELKSHEKIIQCEHARSYLRVILGLRSAKPVTIARFSSSHLYDLFKRPHEGFFLFFRQESKQFLQKLGTIRWQKQLQRVQGCVPCDPPLCKILKFNFNPPTDDYLCRCLYCFMVSNSVCLSTFELNSHDIIGRADCHQRELNQVKDESLSRGSLSVACASFRTTSKCRGRYPILTLSASCRTKGTDFAHATSETKGIL